MGSDLYKVTCIDLWPRSDLECSRIWETDGSKSQQDMLLLFQVIAARLHYGGQGQDCNGRGGYLRSEDIREGQWLILINQEYFGLICRPIRGYFPVEMEVSWR